MTPSALVFVDEFGVDALAVICADDFVPLRPAVPHPKAAHRGLPYRLQEFGIGWPDPKLDPALPAPGRSDRRIGGS